MVSQGQKTRADQDDNAMYLDIFLFRNALFCYPCHLYGGRVFVFASFSGDSPLLHP